MKSARAYFRKMSVLDWAFVILMMAGFGAVSVVVYAHVGPDNSPTPFRAISYTLPAQIQDIEERPARPQSQLRPDIGPPSFDYSEGLTIPVRLERFLDCASFNCRDGSIPISVDVSFVLLDNDTGSTLSIIEVVNDLETAYVQDDDYIQNVLLPVVNQLEPFDLPVEADIEIEKRRLAGSAITSWVIEGVTTPLVSGGIPSSWRTETFVIYAPPLPTTGEEGGE